MTPAIRIQNLGKRYRLGANNARSLGDMVSSAARRLLGRSGSIAVLPTIPDAAAEQMDSDGYFWALKDVSFDVNPGEIVGIIGRNGAGKSTLLKVLAQIMSPTTGHVAIHGRVASLLEVGTGFHPELTGRENVYLNGAILGMTKQEVRRKFDEIVSFAEIEQFIDTPVKRYSSGMYVRLAFAVAAHLEPDILIVDEVLAVGDASFQRKCLNKIGDVGRGGRTVLFVSHNMLAVRSLCKRAILLENGRFVFDGPPETAIAVYSQTSFETECLERTYSPDNEHAGANGVRLHSARIRRTDNSLSPILTVESPFCIELEWENRLPDALLNLSVTVNGNDGVCIFNTCSPAQSHGVGHHVAVCHVPGKFLNDGTYRISVMFVMDKSRGIHLVNDTIVVEVHDVPRGEGWQGKWPGFVRPNLLWTVSSVSNPLNSRESCDCPY